MQELRKLRKQTVMFGVAEVKNALPGETTVCSSLQMCKNKQENICEDPHKYALSDPVLGKKLEDLSRSRLAPCSCVIRLLNTRNKDKTSKLPVL